MILYLDTETYSEVPIKHGTHRYAEGVEILLTAFAIDDGEIEVVEGWPPRMNALALAADEIIIHNSKFDRMVLAATGVDIPVYKIHDTMAQARSVGLPGGLGMLCDVLGVPVDKAKDKEGRTFIQLFCKPRPKNSTVRRADKTTHPVEWARFVTYAGLDVAAMREVYKRLPVWNYRGQEFKLWKLDQKINDRGFAIDLDLARGAIEAVAAEQKRLAKRMSDATGGEVEAATQRDRLLAHLLEAHGVELPDMQKGTLERRVNDEELPAAVRELLAIRLEASGTSTAKYQALVNATSSDGRLRGGLEWCGAARTGRWSGRLFQPQNLPRPKHSPAEIGASIEAMKAGCADLIFDDVIARASSAIRGAIVAPEGRKLIAADLSNIEGRVLAWLAGEDWKLKAFADFDKGIGPDLYLVTAGGILGKKPEDVTPEERQSTGKVPELACGFQGAVGAFSSMAQLYGLVLPEDEVLRIVKAWRKRHPATVSFWYGLERKALEAVRCPGVTLDFGRLKLRRDGSWLRIILPSGRALCYPSPKVAHARSECPDCAGAGWIEDETDRCSTCNGGGVLFGRLALSYKGVDQYTRKWQRINTYGGKLAENVTQATARDVIAYAMPRAEAAGYEVVLTVHDELLTETPDTDDYDDGMLSAILADNPPWARGLPLAAAGFEGKRYGKQ